MKDRRLKQVKVTYIDGNEKVYDSAKEACTDMNISYPTLENWIYGRTKKIPLKLQVEYINI